MQHPCLGRHAGFALVGDLNLLAHDQSPENQGEMGRIDLSGAIGVKRNQIGNLLAQEGAVVPHQTTGIVFKHLAHMLGQGHPAEHG